MRSDRWPPGAGGDANPLDPGKPWNMEVPSEGGDQGPGSIDVDKLVTAAATTHVDGTADTPDIARLALVQLNWSTSPR